jgi:hypothetical protein
VTLKLGLPSKGRLQADAIDWFAARGVTLERTGSEREYAGRVRGIGGVDLVLLSAAEIPAELARGRIHLGVTGQDLVREHVPHWADAVSELAPLGFGRADLVVAVPARWIDVMPTWPISTRWPPTSAPPTATGCGSRPSTTTSCATSSAPAASPTTSSSTARAPRRARSRTAPPRRSPTSPPPARPCATTTSASSPTA